MSVFWSQVVLVTIVVVPLAVAWWLEKRTRRDCVQRDCRCQVRTREVAR